ncbi:MAG: SDR family oxidoreductase [Planctomycetota bacterium]|jgi:dTDP-glucose 4,6-dehydratase|nr:SDR family oxidoreductase [Planctomycetota bacterium]
MPRAIVAGGSGFLGSHLCDRLLAEGFEVIALDNFVTGHPKNLAHLTDNNMFELREQDIIEPFSIEGDVDYVFNMASPASPIDYLQIPLETLRVGSEGNMNMLELARAKQAGFLQASTSECYGDPLVHPQIESYWGNVNPIGPRSCYDESKRFAEAMTMAYHRQYGLNTHLVRIFNTYGPRMRLDDGRVVPALMCGAINGEPLTINGDGKQTRSFCYVDDLIDGIFKLMMSDEHLPTNVGNPVEMTILEFAETVNKVVGSEHSIEFRPMPEDDPQVRRPDISKAKEVLNWEPKISLERGLELSLDYFKTELKGLDS